MFPSYDPMSLYILNVDEVTQLAERRRRLLERNESEGSAIDARRPAPRRLLPPFRARHA